MICWRKLTIIKQQHDGAAGQHVHSTSLCFVCFLDFVLVDFFFLAYKSIWHWRTYKWSRKQKLERTKEDFIIPRKQESQHFRPLLPENGCICESWWERKTIKTCRWFLCLEAYEMCCHGPVSNIRWKASGEGLGKRVDSEQEEVNHCGRGQSSLYWCKGIYTSLSPVFMLQFMDRCWEKNEAYWTVWC